MTTSPSTAQNAEPVARAKLGAFSYKTTHENIIKELTRRATSGKNVDVYMPTIRLATTIDIGKLTPSYSGCKYFCVGTNGFPNTTNITGTPNNILQDLYNLSETTQPIVGFTFDSTNAVRIVRTDEDSMLGVSVPPPKISEIILSRNTNGRITRLQGKIEVPSFAQYDVLSKYFLIPGVGVLFEAGNINTHSNNNGDEQTIVPEFFDLTGDKFSTLVKRESNNLSVPYLPLEVITEKSIECNGSYTAFFGRMGNFSTSIVDNTYIISFECVGVGDASMGISLYETYTDKRVSAQTETNTNSANIIDWFVPKNESTTSPFYQLLINIINSAPGSDVYLKYGKHVNMFSANGIKITQQEARKQNSNNLSSVTRLVGDYENPIFISWPFFVNVILNSKSGIRNIFKNDTADANLSNIKLLYPLTKDPATGKLYEFGTDEKNFDSAYEPLIGSHKRLRSIDAGTMIIYNEEAQNCVYGDSEYRNLINFDPEKHKFDERYTSTGTFHKFTKKNAGTLSHGVWLNVGAIVQAFESNTTFHGAITTLLQKMNVASGNYWNLALDFSESTINDFIVVDLNFNEAGSTILTDAYKNAHIFNKPFGLDMTGGSELISLDFELSLSKMLMAQAIFSTREGKVSNAGTQSDSTRASDLDLEDYDLTRTKINVTTEQQMGVTSLDGGILTYSNYSVTAIQKYTGQVPLDGAIASQNIERITSYQNAINASISNSPENKLLVAIENGLLSSGNLEAAKRDPFWKSLNTEVSISGAIQAIQEKQAKNQSLDAKEKVLLQKYTEFNVDDPNTTTAERTEKIRIARNDIAQLEIAKNILAANPNNVLKDLPAEELEKMRHLEIMFGMIELLPNYMKSKMAKSAVRDPNNNLGFNGMIPLKTDLKMAGIGGLRSGEIIRIARLPKPYTESAFMILGTIDEFTTKGWITTIEARYLPMEMFVQNKNQQQDDDSCGAGPTPINDSIKAIIDTPPSKKYGTLGDAITAINESAPSNGPCPQLKALISRAEGNYESINRGRAGDTTVGSADYNASTGNKRLTEMTIGEILARMDARRPPFKTTQPGTILAAGKYQVIPGTFKGAIAALKLSPDTLFTKTTQELVGNYLLTSKPDRKNLNRFLKCDPNVTIEDAALDLAYEFASFPVPYTVTDSDGVVHQKGTGYYDGNSGNRAKIPLPQVLATLQKCREGCKP